MVPPPKFGFVDYAERINSRAAMVSPRNCALIPQFGCKKIPGTLSAAACSFEVCRAFTFWCAAAGISWTLHAVSLQIGFFALLLLEGVTNKGLLEMIGVSVGKGLNIGF